MDLWNACFIHGILVLLVLTVSTTSNIGTPGADDTHYYRTFVMPGVSPQMKDSYVCTIMVVNATEEWIVRYEPLASANRAHHMLLYGCSGVNNMNDKGYWDCGHHGVCSGSRIIYAWAKNAPALNLPKEVGFRIGQNYGVKYLVLQIHYVNPIPVDNKDHSGLKMLMTSDRQKYKAGIYLLAKQFLIIPPYTEKVHGDVNCVVNLSQDIHLFAFRVHAHALGVVISGYRYDQDKKILNKIAKGNPQWPQSFYPTDETFKIKPNDILHARCTFNSSQRGRNTFIGATSNDEMCNLYLMYYTDREKGPDSGFCGNEQFSELSDALPSDSDQPLPNNDMLRKESVGENKNKDKEISYENIFEQKPGSVDKQEEPNQVEHTSRMPVKPEPVKLVTGYEAGSKKNAIKQNTADTSNIKPNKEYTSQLHFEENWGPKNYKLGQVSGVAVDSEGDVVIFHRADRVWDSTSFDGPYFRDRKQPILKSTLLHMHRVNGSVMQEWGEKLFFMPHGLTIDAKGNIWLTDVGLHQVFKFPPGYSNTAPQITLGNRFEPGSGKNSFCKPTGVAVMENGEFFVSDGYCNSRIIYFTAHGKFLREIKASEESPNGYSFGTFKVPHSLTLARNENELCTADREHGRVLCFYTDSLVLSRKFQFGEWGQRIFSAVYSEADEMLYVVNGQQFLRGHEIKIFQVNFSSNTLESSFGPHNQGLNNPHDIAISADGNDLYVVEIGPNKIWKFRKDKLSGTSLKTTLSNRRIIPEDEIDLTEPTGPSLKTTLSNRRIIPQDDIDSTEPEGTILTLYGEGWSSSSISYIVLSLLIIPIIVVSVIWTFLHYGNGSLHRYFGSLNLTGKHGSNLFQKKHGFARLPTKDIQESDSTDSDADVS